MCLRKELHFKIIDSTSTFLKRRCLTLPNFCFVSADYQTNGRGRLGRVWNSNERENLMFSVLVKDKTLTKKFHMLSICSSLAVLKVLKYYNINNLMVKWPNDVYVNDKKICGILLDGITIKEKLRYVVIGIGINVNQSNFENTLHPATSMKNELNENFDINKIKKDFYLEIKKMFKQLKKSNDYIKQINGKDYLKDKNVYCEINGERKMVTVVGVNDDASLSVVFNNNIMNLSTGEITFHV